jgi:hypothetical protein
MLESILRGPAGALLPPPYAPAGSRAPTGLEAPRAAPRPIYIRRGLLALASL